MRFPAHRAAFIDVGCPIWAFLFDAGDITLQAGHMPVARAGTIDTLGGGCDGGAELLLVAAHEPQVMVIMWKETPFWKNPFNLRAGVHFSISMV